MTDEHFIVWMRTAGLPTFRKLWGKIETDLTAGTYKVIIENNYDVSAFEGKKSFILSTANSLGGNNTILGNLYIVFGALCLIPGLLYVCNGLKGN